MRDDGEGANKEHFRRATEMSPHFIVVTSPSFLLITDAGKSKHAPCDRLWSFAATFWKGLIIERKNQMQLKNSSQHKQRKACRFCRDTCVLLYIEFRINFFQPLFVFWLFWLFKSTILILGLITSTHQSQRLPWSKPVTTRSCGMLSRSRATRREGGGVVHSFLQIVSSLDVHFLWAFIRDKMSHRSRDETSVHFF